MPGDRAVSGKVGLRGSADKMKKWGVVDKVEKGCRVAGRFQEK